MDFFQALAINLMPMRGMDNSRVGLKVSNWKCHAKIVKDTGKRKVRKNMRIV